MKFSIHSEYFTKILTLANEIIEKSSINTAYSNIAINCKKNNIEIKSADRHKTFYHEFSETEKNKLSIQKEGKALFSGEKILSIFQTLEEEVCVEVENSSARIFNTKREQDNIHEMYVRNFNDYPEVHKNLPEKKIEIKKQDLIYSLTSTAFAASSDIKEGTIFLTGVLIHILDEKINMVATDRNRMSISECKIGANSQELLKEIETKEIIVPSKFIGFIRRVFQVEEDEVCYLAADQEKLYVSLGNSVLSVNLISGKYYDYARIIPTMEGRNYITVNRQTMKEDLSKLTTVFKKGREQSIRVTCKKEGITLSAEEKEEGKSQYELAAQLTGEEGQFTVKALFIIDPLQIMSTEEVTIGFGNNKRDLITLEAVPAQETLHIAAPQNI